MRIEQKFINYVRENLQEFQNDAKNVHEAVKNSKAIYKGEPVPYLYLPRIFDGADLDSFNHAVEHMMSLCNRVIELYETEQSVREYFGFDPRLDELIRIPHYYETKVPMGRFDIFYYGPGSYQFCELNADGASAMNEEFELSKILAHSKAMKSFEFVKAPETFELFESWVVEVKEIYKSYCENKSIPFVEGASFNVGIIDILEKGSPLEFEMFQDAFLQNGLKAKIIDARDLVFKEGALWSGDFKVDCVYRRLVTKDLMDAYDQILPFIEGIKSGAACLIGPIKTQIIHTKRYFEALYSETIQKHLSQAEIEFIKAHVPFTAPLTRESAYLESKDDYIIKPVDYYASKGVCAGRDYDASSWETLLHDKYNGDYIIQKYCPYALVENIVLENEVLKAETFRHITGMFVYNGKLKGIYSRAGRNAIISGLHDGFTLSSLVLRG